MWLLVVVWITEEPLMHLVRKVLIGLAICLVMVPVWGLFALSYLIAPKVVWRVYAG